MFAVTVLPVAPMQSLIQKSVERYPLPLASRRKFPGAGRALARFARKVIEGGFAEGLPAHAPLFVPLVTLDVQVAGLKTPHLLNSLAYAFCKVALKAKLSLVSVGTKMAVCAKEIPGKTNRRNKNLLRHWLCIAALPVRE